MYFSPAFFLNSEFKFCSRKAKTCFWLAFLLFCFSALCFFAFLHAKMIWSVEHATWHCYPTKKSLADLLLLSELRFVQRLLRYAIIGDCTFAFLLFCPLAVLLFCLSRWSVYWNMQLDTSILLIRALRIERCCQNRDCSSGGWETKILATCTVMNSSGQICCLTDDPTM